MRSFSPLERQIIDEIIRIDDHLGLNILSNLLEKRLSDFSYYIEIGPNECTINIEEKHFEAIGKSMAGLDRIKYIVQQTSMDVLRVIKLLEFLEQERLIYIVTGTPTTSLGGRVANFNYVTYRGIPADIQAAIRKYVGIVVISTEALRNLRDRGYLSEEEVRYRESARNDRIAIGCSVAMVGISVLTIVISGLTTIHVGNRVTSTRIVNLPDSLRIANFPESVRIANPTDSIHLVVKDEDLQKIRAAAKDSDASTNALVLKQTEAVAKKIDAVSVDLQSVQQELKDIKAELHKQK